MNFRQMDCFLAVADCLSFSGAAQRLYLSQSSVSQQILSLERELGFELFDRNRHKVSLTPAGAYLHDRYLHLKREMDAANGRARVIAGSRGTSLLIGCDGPLSESLVGAASRLFHERKPEVALQFKRASLIEMPYLLFSGLADAVIVTDIEMDGYETARFQQIVSAGPCVYYPEGHRFEQMKYVLPDDLEGEIVISAYENRVGREESRTQEALAKHGIDLADAVHVDDGDTAFLSVKAGLGIFVASHLCDAYAERLGIGSVDLRADLPVVALGVASVGENPLIDSFVACAQQVVSRR